MKKILTYFFVTMGVLFTVLLIVLAGLWVFDPFEIRPLLVLQKQVVVPVVATNPTTTSSSLGTQIDAVGGSVDQNPYLTPAQEDALSLIGIDPTGVPKTFTPAQQECFVRVLGRDRFDAIVAGDSPTPLELLRGKDCL